ncbi:hypothetical protein ACJMK2_031935 [Sinanodonta woodiana]|uniref:Integrase core domain-containing protein n=1 Tax=Sinanodonta woodiana TaxID=1069815 RepID=A0ABD3X2D5_SINWO
MRQGCPASMRGDRGTENGHVAQMQDFMTGKESFIYGRSTANQQRCQFWIDALGILKKVGQFAGDFIDISLIQFCCMELLQNDIDSMVQVWNVHRIRPTKNQNSPNGRPFVMYKLPMIYGTRSYLQSVDEDKIEICRAECVFRDEHPCDRDVFNICTLYMEEKG